MFLVYWYLSFSSPINNNNHLLDVVLIFKPMNKCIKKMYKRLYNIIYPLKLLDFIDDPIVALTIFFGLQWRLSI